MAQPESTKPPFDPVFINARREAWWILAAWVVCLVWTVGYCALWGYNLPPDQIRTILGMPSWVVWGVLGPWIAATLFSVWFGLIYIADDDLGERDDGEEGHA